MPGIHLLNGSPADQTEEACIDHINDASKAASMKVHAPGCYSS
jgi:hypothetical protein